MASNTVKMGDRYWMTVALARGMCRMVWKKRVKATMPVKPRMNSHLRLCPRSGSPFRQSQKAHSTRLTALRRKTSWGVGRMARALTNRLAEV